MNPHNLQSDNDNDNASSKCIKGMPHVNKQKGLRVTVDPVFPPLSCGQPACQECPLFLSPPVLLCYADFFLLSRRGAEWWRGPIPSILGGPLQSTLPWDGGGTTHLVKGGHVGK